MKALYILLFIFSLTATAQESESTQTMEETEQQNEQTEQTEQSTGPMIYKIEPVPNGEIAYSGNLMEGIFMDDLSWAWDSSIACFPETQKKKFTGKHLFFTGIIPKYSEMEVTVVPNNPDANFSIYAYEIGVNNNALVPNLSSCIRCEADHFQERQFVGRDPQDHTRTVKNLVAINRPYRVVIGVTGAEGLEEGDFTLVVKMKTR